VRLLLRLFVRLLLRSALFCNPFAKLAVLLRMNNYYHYILLLRPNFEPAVRRDFNRQFSCLLPENFVFRAINCRCNLWNNRFGSNRPYFFLYFLYDDGLKSRNTEIDCWAEIWRHRDAACTVNIAIKGRKNSLDGCIAQRERESSCTQTLGIRALFLLFHSLEKQKSCTTG
jgi:hypothetical protein